MCEHAPSVLVVVEPLPLASLALLCCKAFLPRPECHLVGVTVLEEEGSPSLLPILEELALKALAE